MSNNGVEYIISESILSDTADAIRELLGTTSQYSPSQFAEMIRSSILPIDRSWEYIRQISDAGQAANVFAVGDRKGVKLTGTVGSLALNGTYYCYIIGINHNANKEGANRIHFQFGYSAASGGVPTAFCDSGYNSQKTSGAWFNMNNTSGTAVGWRGSQMRNTICPAFKNAMPADLQAVLKTITKYSDNTGDGTNTSSNVTATTDTIFLPSVYEVTGGGSQANIGEELHMTQYEWYANGNPTVKYKHNATGTAAIWWTRSAYSYGKGSFVVFNADGHITTYSAYNSFGFAPCFCV